jgi:hypothetical protein
MTEIPREIGAVFERITFGPGKMGGEEIVSA